VSVQSNNYNFWLEEARRLNYHSYSCWTTGGEETCQKCWSLAEELMKRRLR
jgi:hypothetical protein